MGRKEIGREEEYRGGKVGRRLTFWTKGVRLESFRCSEWGTGREGLKVWIQCMIEVAEHSI